MEVGAVLSLYEGIYYKSEKKTTLRNIVSDDDSTMRALLKHEFNHPRGKFNVEIPEPSWLADPSRRTKVVTKPIFALAAAPKSKSSCTKVDVIQMKIYYGYMMKINRMKTIAQMQVASKVVIEYLFNNHDIANLHGVDLKK